MKVLIVEDARAVNKLVSEMLSSEGYEIDSCYCYDEAVSALKDKKYDFVITDIIMPDHDGIELMEYIREHYAPVDCPYIIAMSGGSDNTANAETVIQSVGDLADHVLKKPFSKQTLTDAMFNLLEQGK